MDLLRPDFIFVVTVAVMFGAGVAGSSARRRQPPSGVHEDLGVLLSATLTLLGLLIGFSFSMGASRYDQRKNFEEEEANAIGTEYVRAELLPAAQAAQTKQLLATYLGERILWYTAPSNAQLAPIDAETARLQGRLWESVRVTAAQHQTPINSLVAAGMNDVLNAQGYTQAAWRNRIPNAAWILLFIIGVVCNFLYAFNASREGLAILRVGILPLIVATTFYLVADIDSPRGGLIHVAPQNLITLEESFTAP
jgi:hypothetical protein